VHKDYVTLVRTLPISRLVVEELVGKFLTAAWGFSCTALQRVRFLPRLTSQLSSRASSFELIHDGIQTAGMCGLAAYTTLTAHSASTRM
jgi:hypothetical protein